MRKKGDLSEFECGVVVGVIGRVLVFKKRFICWEFPTQLFRGFTQDGVKKGKGKEKKSSERRGYSGERGQTSSLLEVGTFLVTNFLVD